MTPALAPAVAVAGAGLLSSQGWTWLFPVPWMGVDVVHLLAASLVSVPNTAAGPLLCFALPYLRHPVRGAGLDGEGEGGGKG